jgi:hypothetical protein
MPRSRLLLVAVLVVVPFFGCTKGNECDRCSVDEDCSEGFLCTSFSDGSKRCGSGVGATTCRVR